MMTEWDKLPKHFFQTSWKLSLMISQFPGTPYWSPVKTEALSGLPTSSPWLPARSNFYFVRKTHRAAWFPFIIDKSQLQLGSGIRSFSGNKSFRSHLLNTDPVVKPGNKNYYPYLLSLSTKKIYFQLFAYVTIRKASVTAKGNMCLHTCAISLFLQKCWGMSLNRKFIITILRY